MLSPCLFNIYIDDSLKELCTSGCGSKVTNAYVGCLAYADDILLLSPTVIYLQRMINICKTYRRGQVWFTFQREEQCCDNVC